MATVDKDIADTIIQGNGFYPGDENLEPAVLITEYDNAWGGTSYGVTYEGEPNKYTASPFVREPRLYWQRTADE